MRLSDFSPSKPGRLVQPEPDYWAFVPAPLAPRLRIGAQLLSLLSHADRSVGRLAGMAAALPNPTALSGPFIRREAACSCGLDGRSLSLADLLVAEAAPDLRRHSTTSIALNQVRAHEQVLASGTFRVSGASLAELHRQLLAGVDAVTPPGEFRSSQSWLGPRGCSRSEAVFVPPPVTEMHSALGALTRYLDAPSDLPLLLRLALVHYQLEVIQPFHVGSSLVNRLTLSLLLSRDAVLPGAALCPSAFFRSRPEQYLRRLHAVCLRGDWEQWLTFFLEAVAHQAEDGAHRLGALLRLQYEYSTRLQRREHRPLLPIVDALFDQPALSVSCGPRRFGLTESSMRDAIDRLSRMGIVELATGAQVYLAPRIIRAVEGPMPHPTRAVGIAPPSFLRAPLMTPAVSQRLAGHLMTWDEALGSRPLLNEHTRRLIRRLLRDLEIGFAQLTPPSIRHRT